MNRIYLLMIAFVAFMGSTYAQNSDLTIVHRYSKTGAAGTSATFKTTDTVVIDGVNQVYLSWRVTNNGPDPVKVTDTITIVGNIHRRRFVASLQTFTPPSNKPLEKDSTIGIAPVNPVVLQAEDYVTASGSENIPWCDSVYLKDAAGAIVPDPDTTNNKMCTNVTILFYLLDVDGVEKKGTEAFVLYPNPATNNLNVKFDFGGTNTPADLRIVDLTGKVVYSQDLGMQNGLKDIPLQLTKIPQGLYMVQLNTNAGTFTDRLTIY